MRRRLMLLIVLLLIFLTIVFVMEAKPILEDISKRNSTIENLLDEDIPAKGE